MRSIRLVRRAVAVAATLSAGGVLALGSALPAAAAVTVDIAPEHAALNETVTITGGGCIAGDDVTIFVALNTGILVPPGGDPRPERSMIVPANGDGDFVATFSADALFGDEAVSGPFRVSAACLLPGGALSRESAYGTMSTPAMPVDITLSPARVEPGGTATVTGSSCDPVSLFEAYLVFGPGTPSPGDTPVSSGASDAAGEFAFSLSIPTDATVGQTFKVWVRCGRGGGSASGTVIAAPPEEPGTEDPGTEEPGTEDPGTDDPGTDDPGTDDPGTDDPGTDDPGTDSPGAEDPETDDPDVDDIDTSGPDDDSEPTAPSVDDPADQLPDTGAAPTVPMAAAGLLLLGGFVVALVAHRRRIAAAR